MENLATEWDASGAVDDAQLNFLEELCGPLLPQERRLRRRNPVARTNAANSSNSASNVPATSSTAGASSNSKAGGSSGDSQASALANSDAKIREVRDIVGSGFGEGFILQCLLHYGGNVASVISGIFDNALPPQLAALPQGLTLHEDPKAALAAANTKAGVSNFSIDDKRLVIAKASQQFEDDYDDDPEEGSPSHGWRVAPGADGSDSDGDSDENSVSSDNATGKGKGKGKGRGKSKGPVQGQTYGAYRKEVNKSAVGNHHRKDRAMAKMRKGMM